MDDRENSQDKPLPPAPEAEAGADPSASAGNQAFDIWLHRRLHQLYDSVAAEPIPAELLRMIEDARTRRNG
jgi:hypothetical protein